MKNKSKESQRELRSGSRRQWRHGAGAAREHAGMEDLESERGEAGAGRRSVRSKLERELLNQELAKTTARVAQLLKERKEHRKQPEGAAKDGKVARPWLCPGRTPKDGNVAMPGARPRT